MSVSDEELQSLTDALFDEADIGHDGHITFDELVKVMEEYPDIIENLTMG